MKNLFVVGGSTDYANWLLPMGFKLTNEREEADLFLFTGGEDVDPKLYNEPVGMYTHYNPRRDQYEVENFNFAKEKGLPMVGVCRGLQFLTVMSGGKLVQDVSHPSFHPFHTKDGQILHINSLHHQMALVDSAFTSLKEGEDYELIGWTDRISNQHFNGENKVYPFPENYREPEVVFFPKTRAWGVQGHPEMLFNSYQSWKFNKTIEFLQESVDQCLFQSNK